MNTIETDCPFCGYTVEVNIKWAIKNELVFCGTCCKSFAVKLKKEEPFPVDKTMENWKKGMTEKMKKLTEEDEVDKTNFWDEF